MQAAPAWYKLAWFSVVKKGRESRHKIKKCNSRRSHDTAKTKGKKMPFSKSAFFQLANPAKTCVWKVLYASI